MSTELTTKEMETIDAGEASIIDCISNILGVSCDYVDDDMTDLVHTIYDQIATWGEIKKNVPEKISYPYIDEEEEHG